MCVCMYVCVCVCVTRLMRHDCSSAVSSVDLLVGRGINLEKLTDLAPETLSTTLPFVGLGHRCLLQHTLTK